jgi:CRISPR/Cas system CSM-associated protein Csm3 (group 7 of RAMP superfamily)
MVTKLTLFTANLVQDSALSVSGLDRETTADLSFAIVDGSPTLVGRGLKGAAVAMAKRFYQPLPRAVSDDSNGQAPRRSAWEFSDAIATADPCLRAGVGISHKTGARADGVLYDREIIPAGTKWELQFRVDRSYTQDDAEFVESEGILGYVLSKHWAEGRCWLGGGVARGLGWCHLEDLKAYRFEEDSYETWVTSGRKQLAEPLSDIPVVPPTRAWSFRILDVDVSFGEYKPEEGEAPWGLDMFAVGPHNLQTAEQPTGDGLWAKPSWVNGNAVPDTLSTDRALLMDNGRPLLPGASVRGSLRHAYSRRERASGKTVVDPHLKQGSVGEDDPAGKAFGTVSRSSRILIRDARADSEWAAAKLHMHAEDEFSAGAYDKSKRDAVRLLRGKFPIRIVLEGECQEELDQFMDLINHQVALGAIGHLYVGGHKARGAGAGRWQAKEWHYINVNKERNATLIEQSHPQKLKGQSSSKPHSFIARPSDANAWIRRKNGGVTEPLTIGSAAKLAKKELGEKLVAWWCDPTIDLSVATAPITYGNSWPGEDDKLLVDEIAFFAQHAVWRAARISDQSRFVFLEELSITTDDAMLVSVVHTPARLHSFKRFSSADVGYARVLLREWCIGGEIIGFTVTKELR